MRDIETIAILGAGDTGNGVARAAALAGLHVRLYDPSPDALKRGIEHIRHGVEGAVARGRLSARDRQDILDGVLATTDLDEAVEGADLIIDAGPDLLDVKRELFARLGASCPSVAVLATTTGFPLAAIAGGFPEPGRIVGLRFEEPIEDARRAEVVAARETSAETVERTRTFANRVGMATAVAYERSDGWCALYLAVTTRETRFSGTALRAPRYGAALSPPWCGATGTASFHAGRGARRVRRRLARQRLAEGEPAR